MLPSDNKLRIIGNVDRRQYGNHATYDIVKKGELEQIIEQNANDETRGGSKEEIASGSEVIFGIGVE